MTGPIGSDGRVNPADTSTSSAGNTERVSTENQVSLSYSNENSSELIASSSALLSTQNDQVSLDEPETVIGNSAQVLPAAELVGLKEIVKLFNEKFDLEALDMADTSSVLLLIKGMVSDMRALSGAENIDSDRKELLTRYEGRLDLATNIVSYQNELTPKKALLAEKLHSQSINASNLAQKEAELVDAGGTDQQLEADIAALKGERDLLQAEISSLNADIDRLTASINSGTNQLNTEVTRSFSDVFSLTENMRQRTDQVALVTGEEQRVVTDRINKGDAADHDRAMQKLKTEKNDVYELDGKNIYDQNVRNEQIENEQRLERVFNALGVNVPEGVLGLFSITDQQDGKAFLGKILKEIPDDRALVSVAKTFGAILAGRDPRDEGDSQSRIAQQSERVSENDKAASQLQFERRATEATKIGEADLNLKTQHDDELQVNEQNNIAANAATYSQTIEALNLEASALSLVASAEEERLKTQESINKNSPV